MVFKTPESFKLLYKGLSAPVSAVALSLRFGEGGERRAAPFFSLLEKVKKREKSEREEKTRRRRRRRESPMAGK